MDCTDEIYEAITQFAKTPDLYGFKMWLPPSAPLILNRTVVDMGAHEGSIWIVDSENEQLVICYNTQELQRHFTQPLSSGLVSKAYIDERPVHHKGIERYKDSSSAIDNDHGQRTQHQVSVPFYIAGKLCGAVSAVQLSSDFHSMPRADVQWGFDEDAVTLLAATATVLGEGIESKWIREKNKD